MKVSANVFHGTAEQTSNDIIPNNNDWEAELLSVRIS